MTESESNGLTGILEVERDRLAVLVEQLAERERPGRARLVLIIAARAVRRGRHLTSEEQLDNLFKWIDSDEAINSERVEHIEPC
jgi:hypothetical protein